jgi:chemotaxis protein MotB
MFNRPIKRKQKEEDEEVSYWLSYSDLMAGVLIIFILLFTYKILAYNQNLESKESKIKELTSIRKMIITRLFPKTGVIKVRSNILFDVDQSKIKKEGHQFLQKFIPRYLKVLLGEEDIKKHLSRIVVEGHTDNTGTYLYNLELSQARAFNVVKYIYSEEVITKYKDGLENFISAIGRSEVDLVLSDQGKISKNKSRRVEFKFELKDDKIIRAILDEVKKDKNNI